MKKLQRFVLTLGVSLGLTSQVSANCLNGLDSTWSVHSVIKGIYANPDGQNQYIILDKATCEADTSGGDVQIGGNTKAHYYLVVDDKDTFMVSTLLLAQARNETVTFRLTDPVGGYNRVAYIVTPAKAWSQ